MAVKLPTIITMIGTRSRFDMEFDCATAVSDMFDCMHTSRDSGGGAADLGCCCQTAAAAVRRHSSCGDSRKNNETAYCLSSLWTTRLLPLPPKVQTHLMPSRAAVTGTADALVPVPETLIEADQGFLARQH